MKKIRYEQYATHAENRLYMYPKYVYEWKFEFRKDTNSVVKKLFRRYMHDDIFIKWDLKYD